MGEQQSITLPTIAHFSTKPIEVLVKRADDEQAEYQPIAVADAVELKTEGGTSDDFAVKPNTLTFTAKAKAHIKRIKVPRKKKKMFKRLIHSFALYVCAKEGKRNAVVRYDVGIMHGYYIKVTHNEIVKYLKACRQLSNKQTKADNERGLPPLTSGAGCKN